MKVNIKINIPVFDARNQGKWRTLEDLLPQVHTLATKLSKGEKTGIALDDSNDCSDIVKICVLRCSDELLLRFAKREAEKRALKNMTVRVQRHGKFINWLLCLLKQRGSKDGKA